MNHQELLDRLDFLQQQSENLTQQVKELTMLIQADKPSDAPLIDDDWRTVEEFPKYEVSDKGEVRNANTHRIIKRQVSPQTGKVNIVLRGKTRSLAKIVATAFIDNPSQLSQVAYKDGNALNVTVDNLEWKSNYVARTSDKTLVATSFRDGARIEFPSVRAAVGGSFTERGIYKALKDGSLHCDCYWNWEFVTPQVGVDVTLPDKINYPIYVQQPAYSDVWSELDKDIVDAMIEHEEGLTEKAILNAIETGKEINGYKFKGEL